MRAVCCLLFFSVAGCPVPQSHPGRFPACGNPAPRDTPQQHEVRFHFAANAPALLLRNGGGCQDFLISQNAGTTNFPIKNLQHQLSGCASAGVDAGAPRAMAVSAVTTSPATSPTVVWDGRSLQFCNAWETCGDGGTVPIIAGIAAPLPAGRYTATFSFFHPSTPHCRIQSDGSSYCMSGPGNLGDQLCRGDFTASVEFDLPVTGSTDVTVNVNVPTTPDASAPSDASAD